MGEQLAPLTALLLELGARAKQSEATVMEQTARIKELEAQVAELSKPKEPPDG